MIKVYSNYPPAIAKFPDKTYVVPGWIVVPANTTLDDVEWVGPKIEVPKYKVHKVKNYTIQVFDTGKVTCDCPGFTFRKKCRHSAEFM